MNENKGLEQTKVAFIGGGNMAEAIIKGLVGGGLCAGGQIMATDVQSLRLIHLATTYGILTTQDNLHAAAQAELVVLAVKPQQLAEVLGGLKDLPDPRDRVFISIAAGVGTRRIEELLGGTPRVVRVMPNMPALVRAGVSALCGGRWATAPDLAQAELLMQAVGITVRVTEDQLDAVTAISGSGPAYVFHLMEEMLEAAQVAGLPTGLARTLVYETVRGAALLALGQSDAPDELRRRVTSKGGTTEAAFNVLKEREVHGAMAAAIDAAIKRSRELSKM